ncbi:PHD finger-like domain-containing protein 5A [Merluccius polli]|uniref:PHD finger-like domain-containing protein 5A n=1 Tax=Merluccius polli TaxID=89951 RepID=A0AA47P6Z4_MERPO|nr:PHD finger-like domain-containing protein 5A [Merluccius polli]
MAKHHPDLIFCRKQAGVGDGKCVICDSYVRPCTLVRICDECNYGSYQGRCVICGGPGVSDAYYCKECTIQEKDRDGCPKIVNLGSSKTDLFYERKKYGFKKSIGVNGRAMPVRCAAYGAVLTPDRRVTTVLKDPHSFRNSATSDLSAVFSRSRNAARTVIWFSFRRRASRERLAATLFLFLLCQYFSSWRRKRKGHYK